jgi:DedD protein
MALLDKVFKQRMIGALVLIALAVIFLPMLFSRQDEMRQVRVDPPAAPQAPLVPEVKVEPVPVPEPQVLPQEPVPSDEELAQPTAPSMPIAPAPAPAKPAVAAKPAAPAPVVATAPAKPDTTPRVDPNGLPVSWSIQLASLSNRAGADNLQKSLRSQGFNAYVRSADGKNRVFVGPLVERAEAERLRDVINRQQKLKGFVVRFEPERG